MVFRFINLRYEKSDVSVFSVYGVMVWNIELTKVIRHEGRPIRLSQNRVGKCEFGFDGQSGWEHPDKGHAAVYD